MDVVQTGTAGFDRHFRQLLGHGMELVRHVVDLRELNIELPQLSSNFWALHTNASASAHNLPVDRCGLRGRVDMAQNVFKKQRTDGEVALRHLMRVERTAVLVMCMT